MGLFVFFLALAWSAEWLAAQAGVVVPTLLCLGAVGVWVLRPQARRDWGRDGTRPLLWVAAFAVAYLFYVAVAGPVTFGWLPGPAALLASATSAICFRSGWPRAFRRLSPPAG